MVFAWFILSTVVLTGVFSLLGKTTWYQHHDMSQARQKSAFSIIHWLVKQSQELFPIILLVFVVRSFIAEPFKIPSGSMMPTLLAGDYILVNKFQYGLRMPISNKIWLPIGQPVRGDVIVFHYPRDTNIDYIKRVVGLPGDQIRYQNKQIILNGKPIALTFKGNYDYTHAQRFISAQNHLETLDKTTHDILIHTVDNSYTENTLGEQLSHGDAITIPPHHYFVMGDNRDNSSDSRVWGFVPDENLVGRAFFIWMNFSQWKRVGTHIQ